LAFLQLLNEFDSGKHDRGIRERFETKHGADTELHAPVILFDDVV
jgi:hypothetical protein